MFLTIQSESFLRFSFVLAEKLVVENFILFFLSHQNIILSSSLAVHFYMVSLFFFSPDSLTFNKEICSFYYLLKCRNTSFCSSMKVEGEVLCREFSQAPSMFEILFLFSRQ